MPLRWSNACGVDGVSAPRILYILILSNCFFCKRAHGVVVRAFVLYWGGHRLESLSTHHCWALSKCFIPSLGVWSMTKITHLAEKNKNKKSNGEQSDLCDIEQVFETTASSPPLLDHLAANMVP